MGKVPQGHPGENRRGITDQKRNPLIIPGRQKKHGPENLPIQENRNATKKDLHPGVPQKKNGPQKSLSVHLDTKARAGARDPEKRNPQGISPGPNPGQQWVQKRNSPKRPDRNQADSEAKVLPVHQGLNPTEVQATETATADEIQITAGRNFLFNYFKSAQPVCYFILRILNTASRKGKGVQNF